MSGHAEATHHNPDPSQFPCHGCSGKGVGCDACQPMDDYKAFHNAKLERMLKNLSEGKSWKDA